MVKIFYSETSAEAGVKAAKSIASVVAAKPNATLGLATGSSPLDMYAALIDMYNKGEVSFKGVSSVNLDEYVGLTADHDQSYAYFMSTNLFDKVDIDKNNTNLPCGIAKDLKAECERYNALVASFGGADVQVLGIGLNGHIGFNEPSDKFSKGTNVVDLTPSTINANSRFFATEADVPTQALSMGIDQIMMAKKIILLANGSAKAEILEKSFFGDVTPATPASILQFANDVEVYGDAAALAVIAEKHPEALIK